MKKLLCPLLLLPLSLFAQTNYIEQDRPLNLVAGWNMIGFTCNEPIAVIDAFLPIVDKVLIAKDNNGAVYLPEFGFNGIGFFEYGYGYQLKLTESISDFQFCPDIIQLIEGCLDQTAFNYNPSANMDDGSCYPIIYGCTDTTAYNFNDYDNDGVSNFVTGINGVDVNTSNGVCIEVVNGCTEPYAYNFTQFANTNDGSCLYYGCMDESACNYDTVANTDDGSCEYSQEGYNCDGLDYISILESKYWVVDSAAAEFMGVNINLLESPLVTDELPVCSHDDIFYVSENFMVTKYDGLVNCVPNEESLIDLSGSWFVEGNVLTIVQEDGSYFFEVIQANSDTLIIEFSYNFEVNGTSQFIPARITLINIIPIFGCTDLTAFNYNPSANMDDDSCVPYIYGCMSTAALNYNPSANVQQVSENNLDNPCVAIIEGCTHLTACNYNEFATYYDGSCDYAEQGYDCDGNVTAQIGDIFEGGYLFYLDESGKRGLVAAFEDLQGFHQWGCSAQEVNGADSLEIGYGEQNTDDIVEHCSDIPSAASEVIAYESDGFNDWHLPSLYELLHLYNTIGAGGEQYDFNSYGFSNDYYSSSSEYGPDNAYVVGFQGGGISPNGNHFSGSSKNYEFVKVRPIRAFGNWTMGCMDSLACNYNPEANMSDGSCTYAEQGGICPPVCPYEAFLEYSPYSNSYDYSACITPVVLGCIDSIAVNFNTEANVEDGSCEYILGCMDNGADNFNQDATQEDNSCIYFGCIDSLANNYDLFANQDDGSCIYLGCIDELADNFDANANTDNGGCIYSGCTEPDAYNYDSNANQNDGGCIYIGCTNEMADNYNPQANQDDESCIILGCMNFTADNYNNQANEDDGSCMILGCTFDIFPNYNSEANEEDGSCDMNSEDVFGCTDSLSIIYNELANLDNGSCAIQIGDEAFGGIVFYYDSIGDYGLVSAMEDQTLGAVPHSLLDFNGYEWGCYEQNVNGADGTSIGTGYQNTLDIVNQGCTSEDGGITAAQAATDTYINGYSDWYLPSIDELLEMYNTIGNQGNEGDVGGFGDSWYWASSENASGSALIFGFANGNTGTNHKGNINFVRPIRAFGNWTMGCVDSLACNYNPEVNFPNSTLCEYADLGYDCEGNFVEYIVGMQAEGGIVFYVDETGDHGLVAALEDLSEGATDPYGWGFNGYEWGCYEQGVNGADATSIGTGYQNTIDIVNQGCSTDNGGITAAQAALDPEINGYSDWYLPSVDELAEMYNTIGSGGPEGNIGGFDTSDWSYYWSSSEVGNKNAWRVGFGSGFTASSNKGNTLRVRVIRSF